MAVTFQQLFFIAYTFLFFPRITANTKPRLLATKLVHRHSTFPPFNDSKKNAQSNLFSDSNLFLVSFSVGEPARCSTTCSHGHITDHNNSRLLCFQGIAGQELQGFPSMTFHLANGADLVVDAGGLFYQADRNSFCLSIQPQVQPNFPSIIGITAQQDYNVAFDLDERNINFQRIDCEVLHD